MPRVRHTPQLKGRHISKEQHHSGKNRWRKKISPACLTGRKACLLRVYWRPRFGGGHACGNITTVISAGSRLQAGLGCAEPARATRVGAAHLGTRLPPPSLPATPNPAHVPLHVPLSPFSDLPTSCGPIIHPRPSWTSLWTPVPLQTFVNPSFSPNLCEPLVLSRLLRTSGPFQTYVDLLVDF